MDARAGMTVIEPSSYLRFLPAIYGEHEFWGRFLRIFEEVLTPIQEKIGQVDLFLDPRFAPEAFLTWIASWVGVDFPAGMSLAERRAVLPSLVELQGLRGTRKGLRDHIRLLTGIEPHITESRRGMVLGPTTVLGQETVLSGGGGASHFTVTLFGRQALFVDKGLVARIVEVHCPAHATYSIELMPER